MALAACEEKGGKLSFAAAAAVGQEKTNITAET